MQIGIGQIIFIFFVIILLFGNFPALLKDLARGAASALKEFQKVSGNSLESKSFQNSKSVSKKTDI